MLFTPVNARLNRPALHSFERFLGDAMRQTGPSQNFQQDDKAYRLSFDVPGISREQLQIEIEDNVVRIQTVADAPRQYRGSYELPQHIDTASSSAKLENGVLTLELVKQQPKSNATSLSVQ
ncbi:hypothetical protein B9Z39_00650 [Limnohabitans sp. JirII-29]|uniref:Hsp20/alpha crystallin family protein n=1 Tax=Limnohabitans sp. JirII-29 TaxID=1835756 RepID=UPI000D3B7E60|nr:Hsp20/alpha crystallin family protein [Limnohabitans sp. JirII-29]PUE30078.1 hypothetical protein B9Z39_00650 [Limnohabitans sp. JirII-29]